MTNEQIINKEWEKEFDKEVPGYSMNEYNPGEEPLIRPIMCQREDAKQFIATQLKKERTDTINEIRKEVREKKQKIEDIKSETILERFDKLDIKHFNQGYNLALEDIKTFLNKLD